MHTAVFVDGRLREGQATGVNALMINHYNCVIFA